MNEICSMEESLLQLNSTITELQDKLNYYQFTIDSFKNDDLKACFFTGLPAYRTLEMTYQIMKITN